jgi:hypothetical protein
VIDLSDPAAKGVNESMTTTDLTRETIAAMTYEAWLAHHQAQPGGWLVTAAPEEVLRACYADRLITFDEAEEDQ